MSTRCYPLFVKGNPQLRVFLPNFWMKLVKNEEQHPANVVSFIVSMEMTHYDVKNYLEKIYKVPVINVRTEIKMGEIKKQKDKGYIIKDDDQKYAFVTMPKDHKFEFPNFFPGDTRISSEMKQVQAAQDEHKRQEYKHKDRPDLPNWFGL